MMSFGRWLKRTIASRRLRNSGVKAFSTASLIAEIVIKESAYKHDVSEYAINTCLLNCCRDIILIEEPEKRLFVGFDHNGNPLEVIGFIEEGSVVIIHAMKVRKQFYKLLEETKHE
jgi:hypothetical protein